MESAVACKCLSVFGACLRTCCPVSCMHVHLTAHRFCVAVDDVRAKSAAFCYVSAHSIEQRFCSSMRLLRQWFAANVMLKTLRRNLTCRSGAACVASVPLGACLAVLLEYELESTVQGLGHIHASALQGDVRQRNPDSKVS